MVSQSILLHKALKRLVSLIGTTLCTGQPGGVFSYCACNIWCTQCREQCDRLQARSTQHQIHRDRKVRWRHARDISRSSMTRSTNAQETLSFADARSTVLATSAYQLLERLIRLGRCCCNASSGALRNSTVSSEEPAPVVRSLQALLLRLPGSAVVRCAPRVLYMPPRESKPMYCHHSDFTAADFTSVTTLQ